MAQAEAEERHSRAPDSAAGADVGPGFVEVSVSQIVGRRPGAAVSEVELTRQGGDRLVLHLRGGAALDVVGLADAFRRRGA